MMVNTKTVTDRRSLRFNTFDDAVADAERVFAADEAGRLRRTGNWSAGKTLGHLAWWIDGAFDGYPMRPPWFVRVLGRALKGFLLRKPVGPGMRLPGAPEGTYGVEEMSARQGLEKFRAAAKRLDAAAPTQPNPALGRMTHEQWKDMHLRHAELHLSFLHPES